MYFGRLAAEEGGVGVRDSEPRGGTDASLSLSPSAPPPRASSSCISAQTPGCCARRKLSNEAVGSPASAAINTAHIWREYGVSPRPDTENNRLSLRIHPHPHTSPLSRDSIQPPHHSPTPRFPFTAPKPSGGWRQALSLSLSPAPAPGLPEEGSNCLSQIGTRCPRDLFPTRPKYLWFEKVKRTSFSPAPWDFQCNTVAS